MVQRKGMLGLVRFRMLRAGISKYSTLRLASSSWLWAASRAMPTSAMAYFRLLFAFWQEGICAGCIEPVTPVEGSSIRWRQRDLLVGVGEDPVVDLAGRRNGWAFGVPHQDVVVAEGEAEHEEQNAVARRIGIVENQHLATARHGKMGQRQERRADGLMRFGDPPVAAGFLTPVEGHQAGGDQQEQDGGSGGARARQQALAGGGQRLRGQQVPS